MRYITNELDWRRDGRFHDYWLSTGPEHMELISFGSAHGWQPASRNACVLATEPLEIEQARVWATRDQLVSLIQRDGPAAFFLGVMLDSPPTNWLSPTASPGQLQLGQGDFILRASLPEAIFDQFRALIGRRIKKGAPVSLKYEGRQVAIARAPLMKLARSAAPVVRWYLHLLKPAPQL